MKNTRISVNELKKIVRQVIKEGRHDYYDFDPSDFDRDYDPWDFRPSFNHDDIEFSMEMLINDEYIDVEFGYEIEFDPGQKSTDYWTESWPAGGDCVDYWVISEHSEDELIEIKQKIKELNNEILHGINETWNNWFQENHGSIYRKSW